MTRFMTLWQFINLNRPKNGFTVEGFFSEFSVFLEELTVTSCQFLVCGDFNFHANDNSNANSKQFSDFFFFLLICHSLFKLIGNAPWNWLQRCEKAFCVVKSALTSAATVLAYYDPKFLRNCRLVFFLTFSTNGGVLCSLTLRQLCLFDHSVFWAAHK